MVEELTVTVYFDQELDLKTVKVLPCGSTVADLKAELAQEDPTGQASPADFALATLNAVGEALPDRTELAESHKELVVRLVGEAEEAAALPPEAGEAAALPPEAEEAEKAAAAPCEYRVMQSSLFKKPGSDPTKGKVVKITRPVGSKVRSTGRTWTGPQGGEWAQLESGTEKPGWLLVDGPGFGAPGPLLERVEAGEEPRMVLHAARPVIAAAMDMSNVEVRDIVVRASMKVRDVKALIAGLFDLDRKQIIMSKPKSRADEQTAGNIDNTGAESLLFDDATMGEAGFTHGHDVPFVYMGKL